MSITMIGLDTAKSVFQVHGVNETGKVEIRRKLRRSELIPFFEKQEACTVVMEACGAAHHWARMLHRPRSRRETDRARGGQTLREEGQEERRQPMRQRLCEAASRPDVIVRAGQER